MQIADSIRILEKRAFEAWDDEFLETYTIPKLISGTLTFSNAKQRKNAQSIIDRYFGQAAKKHGIHIFIFYGLVPEWESEEIHCHFDLLSPELSERGMCKEEMKIFCASLWLDWEWGEIKEVSEYRGGRSTGYACAKHARGNIFKVYCPKIGDCSGKRDKGTRHYCKYYRDPKSFRI